MYRRDFVKLCGKAVALALGGTGVISSITKIGLNDHSGIKSAGLYVVEDWYGKPTQGQAQDSYSSDVKIYLGGTEKSNLETSWYNNKRIGVDTVATGAPLGTLHLEDRGTGESMIAKNPEGKIIASWQEKVQREWGGWKNMNGVLSGYLEKSTSPDIVLPRDIPVIADKHIEWLGFMDKYGKEITIGKQETKRPWKGLFDNVLDGSTIILPVTEKDGKIVGEKILLDTEDGWNDYIGLPTNGKVYDGNGNLLYRIDAKWWDDLNLRSWFDGYDLIDNEGRTFAKIKVDAENFAKQIGYRISADLKRDGNLQELGTFYFQKQEREETKSVGGESYGTGVYSWVGEMWADIAGGTKDEQLQSLVYADYVLKLLPDQVKIDDDAAIFNIEEYMDFALLSLKPSQETLANAATSADIMGTEKALRMLVK